MKFVLTEAKEFRRSYEVAAWFQTVLVPAGEYDVRFVTIDYRDTSLEKAYYITTTLPGTVTRSFFPSLFGGVQYGAGDRPEDIGQPSKIHVSVYQFMVAPLIAAGEGPWRADDAHEEAWALLKNEEMLAAKAARENAAL